MRSTISFILLLLAFSGIMAQKTAFQIFDSKGKKISYSKWLKKTADADVICFGELHNNPIGHWLQYEFLLDLIEKRGSESVVVGAEMFESDQQDALSRYLKGEIDAKELKETIKLWPNYDTDYKPVVDLCKENSIDVIATNVPRKYARKVAREGGLKALDSLPEEETQFIAPLPFEIDYELPSYAAMIEMMAGHGGGSKANDFVAAQAVKDATMAHFLLENLGEGQVFYHLNGSYHSKHKEGILWYVAKKRPELNLFNITLVEQSQVKNLEKEYLGEADIIIVVPETMTKTY